MSILKRSIGKYCSKLTKEFEYKIKHQINLKNCSKCWSRLKCPKPRIFTKATEEIRLITGQQPVISISKKSIAGFKVQGMPLGLTVTLRREKMYAF
jgi:ribosomal protein L5